LFFPAGAWVSKLLGIPFLVEINAPLYEERRKFGGLALDALAQWSEGYVWRAADAALPVTAVLGERVVARGVHRARIHVIPNGINPDRFGDGVTPEAAKQALGLQGKCVLGFVGFMREWHRLDRIVEFLANNRRPDLHLLFVGDGPARAELEAQVAKLGLGAQVTFTGIVGRDRIASYIAAFDIALQPAVVEYASPLKLFEYMALGKAISAPSTPNLCEVLTQDHNALLFKESDDAALFAGLKRLCDDAALRARLGAAARATIDERGLTWHANAARVGKISAEARTRRGLPPAVEAAAPHR
jgi:glycosyltransferase involved in cell wall biosynthesis